MTQTPKPKISAARMSKLVQRYLDALSAGRWVDAWRLARRLRKFGVNELRVEQQPAQE